MKKNNKGFTLIEVIAVIVLISVIGALIIPNLVTINQRSKDRMDRSTKLLIENAAKIYVANYKEEVDEAISKSSEYDLPIGKLKAYDFLNISNSEVGISDFNDTYIKITKTTINGKIKYLYDYKSSYKVSSSVDYIPPVIKIESIGNSNCGLKINMSYSDFKTKCQVVSDDNKDGRKILKPIDIKESALTYILTYQDEDSSGNKSEKVIITINTD